MKERDLYISNMMIFMSIYLGDMLKKRVGGFKYKAIYKEVGTKKYIDEIILENKRNKVKLFLLSLIIKASRDSEAENISVKYPYILATMKYKNADKKLL
jgi:hypothetical protein